MTRKKDPEAPYSDKPTPGKPGWNIAKGKKNLNKDFNKGFHG